MAQKEVKQRIGSVKNVQKITRAMEMVAAARLRKAEQRIAALRPYASAIRRMTRQAAEAAQNVPNLPILQDRPDPKVVGIVILTGDRGLAGAFNSQIIRAAVCGAVEHESEGRQVVFFASGRRGVSSLTFRGREAEHAQEDTGGEHGEETEHTALTEYEPDPGEILERLVPDYVEISIFRALLESTASEHGARMTAMRNASENAKELIDDLTLQLNRERQAEITQEIMEVVAGAESLV